MVVDRQRNEATTQELPSACLRKAREDRGLLQDELAARITEELGRRKPYKQSTISEWERGKLPIPEPVIPALARILDVPAESLRAMPRESVRHVREPLTEGAWSGGDVRTEDVQGINSQRPSLEEAEKNYHRWLRAVGVSSEFPRLRSLPGDDLNPRTRLFLGLDHEAAVNQILGKLTSDAPQRIAVKVDEGNGATTLARFIYKEVRQRLLPRRLPVLVTLHSIADALTENPDVVDEERVFHEIRRAALSAVADCLRDPAIAQGPLRGLGEPLTQWMRSMEHEARVLPLPNTSRGVDSQPAPLQPGSSLSAFRHMLETLRQQHDLRLVFLLDCSSSEVSSVDAVIQPHIRLSNVLQVVRAPLSESRDEQFHNQLDEVYFLADRLLTALAGHPGHLDEVDYPWFRPAEVFAILCRHYGEALAMKIDSRLLVGIVQPHRPLRHSVQIFRQRLIALASDWDRMPYYLRLPSLEPSSGAPMPGGAAQ